MDNKDIPRSELAKMILEDIKEKFIIIDDGSKTKPCVWSTDPDDDDNVWRTLCGNEFIFLEGTPEENGFKFCIFCGKPLVEANNDNN